MLGRLAEALHAVWEAEYEYERFRNCVDTAGELAFAARIAAARTEATTAANRLAEALARLPADACARASTHPDAWSNRRRGPYQ